MRPLAPSKPFRPGREAPNDLLTSPEESFDTTTYGRGKDARTRHACETCRLQKVRCLSNSDASVQKCQRCARLNQECLLKPRAPRRMRKRTDTRVAELERKVEVLRAAFEGSTAPDKSGSSSATSEDPTTLIQDQQHASVPEISTFVDASLSSPQAGLLVLSPCGIIRGSALQHTISPPARMTSSTLTPSDASKLFERYQIELLQSFPLILFSDTDGASIVQERNPTLFLAVLTAAAGESDPELHTTLNYELAQNLAKRIVVDGERSLELVQALLISAAFYHPPDAFEKHKYYQYIHMAATMCSELGLGDFTRDSSPANTEDEMERNARYRTAIACYMSCLSVARSLRRPCMMQSGNVTEGCIEALEKSSNATPQDRQLIAWLGLECIMKEVTQLLGLTPPDTPADVTDVRTQSTIKVFETRLGKWEKEMPPGVMNPTLEMIYHYSRMYLLEIALGYDGSSEDFRPPFRLRTPSKTSYALPDLNAARLDCVIASMTSGHALLDVFLRLPLQTLRLLPMVIYIRAVYAIFILLKIFFISSAPGSALGQVMHPGSVKVEEYLNRLVLRMQDASSDTNCRLTTNFGATFSRARDWFRRQVSRTDWEGETGEQDLLEPFRLLTMNTESGGCQRWCPTAMLDRHERAAAQTDDPRSKSKNSINRHGINVNVRSIAQEPNQLGQDALASSAENWQYPTPWVSQTPPLGTLQVAHGTVEPQFYSLFGQDETQISLGEVDYTMDESFDLAKGFDLDSHFWDFDMGDISFEFT